MALRVGRVGMLVAAAFAEGDTVIADLEGKFEDDPDGQPITANDLEVKLGDEVIEKSFTENLLGVRQDEEKLFTVELAQTNYSTKRLPGRNSI
jgi:FKBP-type peptidyl-prolyl cis-trans isomerase (trigger factor)